MRARHVARDCIFSKNKEIQIILAFLEKKDSALNSKLKIP